MFFLKPRLFFPQDAMVVMIAAPNMDVSRARVIATETVSVGKKVSGAATTTAPGGIIHSTARMIAATKERDVTSLYFLYFPSRCSE